MNERLAGLCAFALGLALAACGGGEPEGGQVHLRPPIIEQRRMVVDGTDTLRAVRLAFFRDTLYASYNGLSRIDLFTPDLQRIRAVALSGAHDIRPTSFAVNDSELFVTDHARHAIGVFDHAGNQRELFSSLPDGSTPLMPFVVTYFGGVLYAGDAGLHRVLAISMADAPGITERGELILTIPGDDGHAIGFPSSLEVTADGRLLVGDAQQGLVRVFTCDGRYVYDFDAVVTKQRLAPAALAFDNVSDPTMQDSTSFDPSGVRRMGRFHVVDGNNRQVHMYNSLGHYLASYGQPDGLKQPSGIAIDRKRRRIYIADPGAAAIVIYRYEVAPS